MDVVLLVVAGYMAVVLLVRLMLARRNRLYRNSRPTAFRPPMHAPPASNVDKPAA